MEYISVKQYAEKYGISERSARNYCALGRIEGALLTGKTWNIPADAILPRRKLPKKRLPLLEVFREQKSVGLRGSIYHRTQIDMTYNSNHIEGSKLTHEQTRFIFETNTIGVSDVAVNVDDVLETVNHFRCIDYIIDHAEDKLTEKFIRYLHFLLKRGTSDSCKDWFAVGEYKLLPNEVGGMMTCSPENVHKEMSLLLKKYNSLKNPSFEDILEFHVNFETIHPFQDGNGRIGRLLMFKECLSWGHVPFIITDDLKMFYYRGLSKWGSIREFLIDTCLTAQDRYKEMLSYFKMPVG